MHILMLSFTIPHRKKHSMDLSTIFFYLFILFLSIVLLFRLNRLLFSRNPLPPLPPGPRGLPVVGNMRMMGQLTHRGLAHLAKVYSNGLGLLHLRMGSMHIVAVSTPEMARQVLQVHDITFANRPANLAIVHLTYERADMAFANYGPFWRQMRKVCVIKIFSRNRSGSWASVRFEIDRAVRSVVDGTALNLGELVFALTMNITYKAAFGSAAESDGQDEFVKILQEFSKLFGAFNVGDFLPWLGWIGRSGFNRRLAEARGSLDRFIDAVIDEHVAKKSNGGGGDVEGDMVDELLAFHGENGETASSDKEFGVRLTRDNIKAIIMDVMFGGTETVASAIEWAMAELMNNPEELKKVHDELDRVVGLSRWVHESDLDQLTYLKCVIKETLRLHPPIPLLLHEAAADCIVAGYRIPARSRVMINAWAIGRDRASWADPDEFRPGRFLEVGAPDFKGMDFEYIPFGSGRRSCPGMQLGLYALELTVGHLLHCFDWSLPDGVSPGELDMSDVFGLTAPRATRLVAVPRYRLECPLI